MVVTTNIYQSCRICALDLTIEMIGSVDGWDDIAERFDQAVSISDRNSSSKVQSSGVASDALPIDKYRQDIIRRVERDRVTIIHGETGCGKSSRVPQFLLEHGLANGKVTLFRTKYNDLYE